MEGKKNEMRGVSEEERREERKGLPLHRKSPPFIPQNARDGAEVQTKGGASSSS